ncbi:Uncharacterised protein [Mycobacterium tuberculosis]|nr:Uncharacterised protein [Mycobacterium tuberculosis]
MLYGTESQILNISARLSQFANIGLHTLFYDFFGIIDDKSLDTV